MHDHHLLILGNTVTGEITARYSRIHAEEPEGSEWDYYAKQVDGEFGDVIELLAVVADPGHAHPLVVTANGPQPRDDTAHMS